MMTRLLSFIGYSLGTLIGATEVMVRVVRAMFTRSR